MSTKPLDNESRAVLPAASHCVVVNRSMVLPRLKSKQNREIERELVGLVGVLDPAIDVAQQMVGLVEVVGGAEANAGAGERAVGVSCLVEQLRAELQVRGELVGHD